MLTQPYYNHRQHLPILKADMSQSATLLKVKRLRPDAVLPSRATPGSSGLDLFACIEGRGSLELTVDPQLVPTGIAIEMPNGYDATIRPRSGLGSRGINVVFGTIDSDYRGELLVSMYVFGSRSDYRISHGDRIAQLVVARLADLAVCEVDSLSDTARGAGGHGSTGTR
jgi:dUTP pyrophosphatase